VATTDIARFDDQTVLVVERFDRRWQKRWQRWPQRWMARIPQEDFCQVLDLPAEDKNEAQGGPGMAQCPQVLRGRATAAAPEPPRPRGRAPASLKACRCGPRASSEGPAPAVARRSHGARGFTAEPSAGKATGRPP
jgi:hypothetical protein